MIEPLLQDDEAHRRFIAIGIDTRTRGFDPDRIITKAKEIKASMLFLTAEEAVLQNRLTETRRRHPMAQDRPASAGIRKEQTWLYPLREHADIVINTSELSIHELRRQLEGHFGTNNQTGLTITLMSFGFRHGLPREADIVMDLRFLRNPHWVSELKTLTGTDQAVGEYISQDTTFDAFLDHFEALMTPLLPRYKQEGKSYLTIAFGCTGGRHRSVFTVEMLKPRLEAQGFGTSIVHRDMER
jgi:UPF0042 nucleotide-binding protein